MEMVYREARQDDMPGILDVFAAAITDMFERHNLPPPGPTNPFRVAVHEHILSTGIFHVAQQGDRLVGYACAIVRGETWFLAGFWVRPALQNQHIGMTLLRRVWEKGREAGAKVWFVLASSDLPALSAYMKMGMLPGCQIMAFEGTPRTALAVPDAYGTEPLDIGQAKRLDATMRGAQRPEDHDFMDRMGWNGTQVTCDETVVGYYYVHDGSIGPAAWTHARHAKTVLGLACSSGAPVSLDVPGVNHEALRFAFDSGLRLTHHSHLLQTRRVARFERYIPSGAYLF